VIPGVRSTLGYLDLNKLTPVQLGDAILRKLGRSGTADDSTRESWESYGWLFDVDGYRVAYIPLFSDWGTRYVEKGLHELDITADSIKFELPEAFRRTVLSPSDFVDRPSCRLAFYSLDTDRFSVRLAETSYGDYLRSGEHLDDPLPGKSGQTYRDEFGRMSRERSGDLRPFPLTNICGVGVFVVTSDNYIVATTHSQKSHVYPARQTFAASGTMKWGAAPDPFGEVLRKADKELNHLVDIRELHLIGFGADARKLYFQFSFVEKTKSTMKEIRERCQSPELLFPIQFSLEQVRDSLLGHCWEPAAEAALLTICAKRFGRDAVAKALSDRRNAWASREMRDEWDYRASRPGLLPDMSVRYPVEQLKEGSKRYLDQSFAFIGKVAGKKVLDVGSGTGRFTERLLAAGAEVTCVELCERMIDRMRTRLAEVKADTTRLSVVAGLAQDYVPLERHDLVVCSLVLNHNVRDVDCEALVKVLCDSAESVFIFDDVTPNRKTSPHTRLRSEQALQQMFARHRYSLVKRAQHKLFEDSIAFLKFERATSSKRAERPGSRTL
jgi:2-polyprenyl-3-methyl-5-hydroxy-6-metoxy-1,4-benzoquinol methylase